MRVLLEAIEATGRTPGEDIAIALDPATTELWRDGVYVLEGEGHSLLDCGNTRVDLVEQLHHPAVLRLRHAASVPSGVAFIYVSDAGASSSLARIAPVSAATAPCRSSTACASWLP